MSNIAWQVPVSGSYVKYSMASTGVRYHMSNIHGKYRCSVSYVKYIAVYHVVKVTVAMTRHVTVIAKHIAIQKMYSPKSPKNGVKSRNTRNTRTPPIHILKYSYIYILFLEREGEEESEI